VSRELWEPGEVAFFEYHCLESEDSQDVDLWVRSHTKVTILELQVNSSEGMLLAEREEAAMPFTYQVRFFDGTEGGVWEDELSESADDWYRPDPPERLRVWPEHARL
jgi:hypothetical protein